MGGILWSYFSYMRPITLFQITLLMNSFHISSDMDLFNGQLMRNPISDCEIYQLNKDLTKPLTYII